MLGNGAVAVRSVEAIPPDSSTATYDGISATLQRRLRIAFCCPCMQNVSMTTITIRDVPNQTHAELSARAALAGQSLQEYLRAKLVEVAEWPDAKTLISRARERKQATRSLLPADQILSYRDLDRR